MTFDRLAAVASLQVASRVVASRGVVSRQVARKAFHWSSIRVAWPVVNWNMQSSSV